jgi:ABC-type sugar transport system permease subunit
VPDANDHYRSGGLPRSGARAHAHASASDVLVETVSAFAGSRVSWAAAVIWVIFIAVIAISGVVIGILTAFK